MPISNLTSVLYSKLGLPVGQASSLAAKDPAAKKAFGKDIDGNTDHNHDGSITKDDKNGRIDPEEVWQEVFDPKNREKYRDILIQLQAAGFENPLEDIADVSRAFSSLAKHYKPTSQLETAILFLQLVIPPNKSFVFNGKAYYGLDPTAQGGFGIKYNKNSSHPYRVTHGDLLPREIMQTPVGQRVALCLESAQLLIVGLRAQGIKVSYHVEDEHAYVIVDLNNGKQYALDPAKVEFRLAEAADFKSTDRDGIIGHYNNESLHFLNQGRLDEAMKLVNLVLDMQENEPEALTCKGIILTQRGLKAPPADKTRLLAEAVDCFNKALEVNTDVTCKQSAILLNLSRALSYQEKFDEALACLDTILLDEPRNVLCLQEKACALANKGLYSDAMAAIESAIKLAPKDLALQKTKSDIVLLSQQFKALKHI